MSLYLREQNVIDALFGQRKQAHMVRDLDELQERLWVARTRLKDSQDKRIGKTK
jgi:hypothetical protein